MMTVRLDEGIVGKGRCRSNGRAIMSTTCWLAAK
jgi:hypothetical protein